MLCPVGGHSAHVQWKESFRFVQWAGQATLVLWAAVPPLQEEVKTYFAPCNQPLGTQGLWENS